jgi:hypothetical protein
MRPHDPVQFQRLLREDIMSATPATSVVSLSAIARLCAILTFSATTLGSQAAPTVAPASNDARKVSVVSQLSTGSTIRVATSDRVVFEGRYARLESESLVLYSAAGRDAPRIPLGQIDTLWIRARDHGKGFFNGALIGGALGAGGVALLAYMVTHETGEHCNCGTVVAGTVGVSAFLGGVVGAAIGWPNWRLRWPQ